MNDSSIRTKVIFAAIFALLAVTNIRLHYRTWYELGVCVASGVAAILYAVAAYRQRERAS